MPPPSPSDNGMVKGTSPCPTSLPSTSSCTRPAAALPIGNVGLAGSLKSKRSLWRLAGMSAFDSMLEKLLPTPRWPRARAIPALSGQPMAAQEPRAPVRGLPARAGERPELRLVLTGYGYRGGVSGGVEVRGHVSLDELADLYRRRQRWSSQPLRGLRHPAARGDGLRLSRLRLDRRLASRGLRRRRESLRPGPREAMAAGDRWTRSTTPRPGSERGLVRARAFTGRPCARRHEQVYRELAA